MALLTFLRYQTLTGDVAGVQADVEAAIVEAERAVAEYLRRPLPEAEYTDVLYIDTDGRSYPRATPVTALPGGTSWVILDSRSVARNTGVPLDDFTWEPQTGTGYLTDQPRRSVTYTGGWTAATLPFAIARTIARVAYRMANPAALDDLFRGATSVSVDGASASWSGGRPGESSGRSELESLAPGAEAALSGFRWTEDYA